MKLIIAMFLQADLPGFALHTLSHLICVNPNNNKRSASLPLFKDEEMEAHRGEIRPSGELDFHFDQSYL